MVDFRSEKIPKLKPDADGNLQVIPEISTDGLSLVNS